METETRDRCQRLGPQAHLTVSSFIIIAHTILTVWLARVVGADGATKAGGGEVLWWGEEAREAKRRKAYVLRWLPTQGRSERHDNNYTRHALPYNTHPTPPHTQFAKVLVLE